MKKKKSESKQQQIRTEGGRKQQLQQCILKWNREAERGDARSGKPQSESILGLRSRADERLEALRWYVTHPGRVSSGRSQRTWDVVERIRRRYRRRLGARAKWREFVAARVGVNIQTVSAWRVGTQRPSPERKAKLLELCRELGRRGRSKTPNQM